MRGYISVFVAVYWVLTLASVETAI